MHSENNLSNIRSCTKLIYCQICVHLITSDNKLMNLCEIGLFTSDNKLMNLCEIGLFTSDNKLMNLCEIELFHIVCGVLKVLVIIISRFGENNDLGPKYIDIYKFRGVRGGGVTWSTLHFLFIIHKN